MNHSAVLRANFRHGDFEVKFSWTPADYNFDSERSNKDDFALLVLDVELAVMMQASSENQSAEYEKIDGVKDLITAVQSDTLLTPNTPWSGRVFLCVPTRSGYLARSKCFQHRFVGCGDLGNLVDRTVFGQKVTFVDYQNLKALFDGCLFMLIRPGNCFRMEEEAAVAKEIYARINFQWMSNCELAPRTLALVDGSLNLQAFLPLYNFASALGIKLVILDYSGHWISEPPFRNLYQDFIPIDMTADSKLNLRIAAAVKTYGNLDGICTVATRFLAHVAKAAQILGLPTESPEAIAAANNKYETRLIAGDADPTILVTSVIDLRHKMQEKTFVAQYPLIVKPISGTGSEHVCKADNETELFEGVRRTCESSNKKILIEAYIDGPELDVNFVLQDGEILFFEISDDFPSPGDSGTIDSDFWENTNILPSQLPAVEYTIVREKLHQLLLNMGLKTGVFHLEARVQNSSVAYSEEDGILDLREKVAITDGNHPSSSPPCCFLIEINPRPPGFQVVLASEGSYGVNMYDLHILASIGDHERFRALAKPFEINTSIPNHARAWSQLVWIRADRGGICVSHNACGDFLQRLAPEDRELVTEAIERL
ncbi:hypothetical protein EYC80_001765 [Monilinia laxa]|uniref:ATP-grasp domain-containing protein n=1 Tax=Monilinia laxa TaxID=61186 RepID=A0A5N6K657_MONLA|nr:hypothetical protein EYC80_001765 [Monilinia laxa]